ncbi:MAG: hypothetical protein B1H12_02145 [Desulfobacteraceae bacterium 4484_190.2]|nr:MAG: hypothetical protein B1H12_02145 [Desulfobacteraceae bacterium 4484_190.2]
MFSYQVRPRVFKRSADGEYQLPADCQIRFHFLPEQPFGVVADGGRTAVRSVAAKARFNAYTGQHEIQSREPLQPLNLILEEPGRVVELLGRTLTVSQRFDSLPDVEETIRSVFFAVPTLLNVTFADPPYVERVDGSIGNDEFRWELRAWHMEFLTTTQELQQQHVAQAWERMSIVAASHRRRLLAALHYFHLACRLAREGYTAGEFVAEVVLNLSKALEVLFPSGGDGRTRDAVRTQLRALGFTESEIEGNYLPAIALRNEIDVGHVELGLFRMEQLKMVHAFTERAESAFRIMFQRLIKAIEEDRFDVTAYKDSKPRKEALDVIERLREYTPAGVI